jgi:hypothetical protein
MPDFRTLGQAKVTRSEQEREKKKPTINSGHYVLHTNIKGSASTLLGPTKLVTEIRPHSPRGMVVLFYICNPKSVIRFVENPIMGG